MDYVIILESHKAQDPISVVVFNKYISLKKKVKSCMIVTLNISVASVIDVYSVVKSPKYFAAVFPGNTWEVILFFKKGIYPFFS